MAVDCTGCTFGVNPPGRVRHSDRSVRSEDNRLRHRNAHQCGGPPVDHQLEVRGLFHGQVCRLRALEDVADEVGDTCENRLRFAADISAPASMNERWQMVGILACRAAGT
jgi:hypothetical protein